MSPRPVARTAGAGPPTERAQRAQACTTCRHFCGAPREIEALLPGLRTLGSAYGAVRAADGVCSLHDRYLDASSTCVSHEPGGVQAHAPPEDPHLTPHR